MGSTTGQGRLRDCFLVLPSQHVVKCAPLLPCYVSDLFDPWLPQGFWGMSVRHNHESMGLFCGTLWINYKI